MEEKDSRLKLVHSKEPVHREGISTAVTDWSNAPPADPVQDIKDFSALALADARRGTFRVVRGGLEAKHGGTADH